MSHTQDLLIGIDAGTSVIKAVAFDLGGRQIAVASVLNHYALGRDGSARQSLSQTWDDCARALRDLGRRWKTSPAAPLASPSPLRATGHGWSARVTGR